MVAQEEYNCGISKEIQFTAFQFLVGRSIPLLSAPMVKQLSLAVPVMVAPEEYNYGISGAIQVTAFQFLMGASVLLFSAPMVE
jgi:hypothetical protein